MNMKRPIYETDSDLAKEKEVQEALYLLWEVTFNKLPRAYHVDWMLTRKNEAKAFVELKCRNNNRHQYPTLMLSLHKWMHGKALAQEIGGKFLIIVKWNDGIFYHTQGWCDVTYGIGGRKDRGDNQDIEPVVYIPVDYFKRVGA